MSKHITVLDFVDGRVYQYKIKELSNEWGEEIEKFLTRMGHNLGNCEWMVHETASIIKGGVYERL